MWATYSGWTLLAVTIFTCTATVATGKGVVAGLQIIWRVALLPILLAGLIFAAVMVAWNHYYSRATPVGRVLMVVVALLLAVGVILFY
jgi:hypothetical protein